MLSLSYPFIPDIDFYVLCLNNYSAKIIKKLLLITVFVFFLPPSDSFNFFLKMARLNRIIKGKKSGNCTEYFTACF